MTIEIGGGIGNLKQRLTDVVATDIQFAPWLDCVADAQRLPFAGACAANIVMVDVLHHVEFPAVFFREAERVLRAGRTRAHGGAGDHLGQHAVLPAAASRAGSHVGRYPDGGQARSRVAIPTISNQAIPTLIATRDRERFHRLFPALRIERVEWFSLAAYPLSGGFKPWSLIGEGVARRLLRVERAIEPVVGRVAAFRMLLIIEKA